MNEPLSTLQTYFANSLAQMLAQAAPLTLLSGCLDRLLDPTAEPNDGDAAARVQHIAERLASGDLTFARGVATALVNAGPALAQALPTHERAGLVVGLERGMQQAGGPLAVLAPAFAAALGDSHADWAALRAQFQQATSATQTMDVGENATVAQSGQSVAGLSGMSTQTMRVAARGRISDSPQQISGGHSAPRGGTRDEPRATGDLAHRARLITTHTRRLHELEARAALEGTSTPPQVQIEIEDIRRELARL